MATLAEQITEVYLNEEDYYAEKMSEKEANAHHESMLRAGQIITVSSPDGILLGYLEFSINNGCCFINDVFIRPAYRRSRVAWMLKKRLFEVCDKTRVFLGERNKFGTRFPEVQLRRHDG